MKDFNVSVIIPAYNREKYIKRAILSTLIFNCVKETIIIDDGSQDSTLKICQQLSNTNPKIKVYTHPEHKNKGVSASRNLGIKKAQSEFVAFLDSDDYYLENRFDAEIDLYSKYKDFDGAYNASEWVWTENNKRELYTIKESIEPSNLFKTLLWHDKGLFHISTITIKKELLNKTGYFDENMQVVEDMDLWYRIAAYGNIYSGNINTPTSERIIHGKNVIITAQNKYHDTYKYMYKKILKNLLKTKKISFNNKNEIILVFNNYNYIFNKVYSELRFITKLLIKYPFLFFYPFTYRKIAQIIKKRIQETK